MSLKGKLRCVGQTDTGKVREHNEDTIAFDGEVRYEHPVTYAALTAPGTVARFRQIDMHVPHVHHDALEFADGTIVKLARLTPGQRATVLQLPSVPLNVADAQPSAEQRPADLSV